jgi:hypothetical protein
MPPSRATPANLGLPREKAISPFSPKAAGGLEGPKLGTVAAGYPARPVTVRPLKVSQTFSNKGTGKVPAGLGLADPVTDGLNSIGDLVTKPAPTIGTGIGQILTGGKGLHPNTQDTDSGPPNSPGNGQRPGQPQSLHAANQAQAQKWSASQAQTQFRTAKNNYYAAKDA